MTRLRVKIIGAFVAGILIVLAAFYLRSITPQAATTTQPEVSVAQVERSHIPVADSNGNNIPDWQDELIRTKPLTFASTSPQYESPQTLTGQFALQFFEDMIRANQSDVFGATPDQLVDQAAQQLVGKAKDELYTRDDIRTTPDTATESLRTYGNTIALIALSNPTEGEAEAYILQDVLRYDDTERLRELDPIIAAYANMVALMLNTSVPETYVAEHLALLNAYKAVLEDIKAMRMVDEDPLYTFLRLKRYQDDVLGMINALIGLYDTLYLEDEVRWEPGDPALRLVNFDQ